MKLKLDENLPESLLPFLTGLGHEADNVRGENLTGRADPDIWQTAQEAEPFLITQVWISRISAGLRRARIAV